MKKLYWISLIVASGIFGCASENVDETPSFEDTETSNEDTSLREDTQTERYSSDDSESEVASKSEECPIGTAYGAFKVSMLEQYSSVDGKVSNGLSPVEIPQLVSEDGYCQLLRRLNPICDTSCESGYTCGFSGECELQPTAQDAGVISISGLEKSVSMEPIQPGNRYFDTSLSHPPFAEGDELRLVSTDGFAGTLDLKARGVAPLTIADERWLVQQGSALSVNWNTGQLDDAEVVLTFDVNQHGVSPLFVRCIFPDTGAGSVPQAIIDQLLTLDESPVSGFPSGYLIRRTIDSSPLPQGEGCVEFSALASAEATVRVAGFEPCKTNGDCPSDMTCNTTTNLCQ